MEFLTTYAWAFLVIIIMIGALAYFGILSPSKLLPERCNFGSEISCMQYAVQNNGMQLKLKNNAGSTIMVDSIIAIASNPIICSSTLIGVVWEANEIKDAPVICDFTGLGFAEDEKAKLNIDIQYHAASAGSSYTKTIQGEVLAVKGSAYILLGASCQDILNNNPSTQNHDGTYTIDPDGEGGNAPFDVYCDMTTDGGGWTRILTLIDNGAKTNNMLNKGITFTTMRAVKATDRAVYRQATFSTAQAANQGLNANAIEINRQVFLTGPGGYGVFTSVSGPCSWGGAADAIGAGYDGGTCGTEASLRVGRVAGTSMPERYNVDIFIK